MDILLKVTIDDTQLEEAARKAVMSNFSKSDYNLDRSGDAYKALAKMVQEALQTAEMQHVVNDEIRKQIHGAIAQILAGEIGRNIQQTVKQQLLKGTLFVTTKQEGGNGKD